MSGASERLQVVERAGPSPRRRPGWPADRVARRRRSPSRRACPRRRPPPRRGTPSRTASADELEPVEPERVPDVPARRRRRRSCRDLPAAATGATSRRRVRAAARWPSTTSSSVAGRPGPVPPATRASGSPSGSGNRPTTRPASSGPSPSTTRWPARAASIDTSRRQRPPPRTTSRSQACSMSVMTCELRSAVAPDARTASTRTWRNSRRASGSSEASGSSSSRTGARVPSAIASPTCACCPPESSSARASSGMSSWSSRRSASTRSNAGRQRAASDEVIGDGQLAVQRRRLRDVPDPTERLGAVPPRVDPVDEEASRRRALEADAALDEGRLAGAVRARRAR